ncbi:MAG: 1-(5-phosphoribosyl)-5-[(5-phosphoribosylamino)methylideneamino] imidazole-4-carboxamide isomerase [Thermaerobacter sp.]|nr:1-(5-phosphoribosyl)-5-[(5-phosphoribosylamino)methylideneamino] imidazole-4-carboxamide isomerase [Thermaerobacter sp.]
MFEIIPAIDLSAGRVVRLSQGDARRSTVYGDDAVAVGRRWVRSGARRLHVVDLDAAFGLGAVARGVISGLGSLDVALQVGGGIRDIGSAVARLEAGATDVVAGSLLAAPERLAALVAGVGADRIVGAIDVCRGGLQIAGWRQKAAIRPMEAFEIARSLGISRFFVTAVERDGTEQGPNLSLLRRFRNRGCTVWASGGIGRLEHLIAVASLGLDGAIVGRALYEGRFSLEEALRVVAC